jgi:predicted HTH transcriptional regulator
MTLFDFADAPLARATDPQTSHDAARNVTASGTRAAHCATILAAVKANPGSTAGELAEFTGIDRVEVGRRLPDLRNAGQVRNTRNADWGKPSQYSRTCLVYGNKMMTWYATEERA